MTVKQQAKTEARLMERVFVLKDGAVLNRLIAFLKANADGMAAAGRPIEVLVAEHARKRSGEQNRRLHAMLNEIAQQAWVDGRQYDADTWKEHYRRLYLGAEEIVLPDGVVVERGRSTTGLSVAEFNDFMTRIEAHAVGELGVEIYL